MIIQDMHYLAPLAGLIPAFPRFNRSRMASVSRMKLGGAGIGYFAGWILSSVLASTSSIRMYSTEWGLARDNSLSVTRQDAPVTARLETQVAAFSTWPSQQVKGIRLDWHRQGLCSELRKPESAVKPREGSCECGEVESSEDLVTLDTSVAPEFSRSLATRHTVPIESVREKP